MKIFLQEEIARYRTWRKSVLLFAPLELLLVFVVLGLLVITIVVCTKFTKGPSAITALKDYLKVLQLKFIQTLPIDADVENGELEKLLNNVKCNCDRQIISNNVSLKSMFDLTCKQIKSAVDSKDDITRSSWLKFRDVTLGFNDFYFYKVI